jgi:hypothetical protein
VCQIATQSREGQILTSIPPISPLFAATLMAVIGSIANFECAADLKSYLGWAPKREQTGTSYDRTRLTQGGSREAKKVLYLIVWRAIQTDIEWSKLYKRLVPRLCSYDERTQSYKGRGRSIGHVAGRLITLFTEVFHSTPHSTFNPACEELLLTSAKDNRHIYHVDCKINCTWLKSPLAKSRTRIQ